VEEWTSGAVFLGAGIKDQFVCWNAPISDCRSHVVCHAVDLHISSATSFQSAPNALRRTTYDKVPKDSLPLEERRVEVTSRIQLVEASEEGVLGVGEEDLQVGGLVGHGALGLIGEEETFVAFSVDEKGNFGEVAGG